MASKDEDLTEKISATEEASATVAAPNGFGLYPYYSNRYHLWANDQIMRFVLGDSITGNDQDFKIQFIMTRQDAAAMLEAAQQLLKDTDPKIPPVLK